MSIEQRQKRVVAILLFSMAVLTVLLAVLGRGPTGVSAFSLSCYNSLLPIEQVIRSQAYQSPSRWSDIRVCYRGSEEFDLAQGRHELADCHFIVLGDGRIVPTAKWQEQSSVDTGSWLQILVCVAGTSETISDFQVSRVQSLLEELSRRFEIEQDLLIFPSCWP